MKFSRLLEIIEEEIYKELAERGAIFEQDDEDSPRISDREKKIMQRLAAKKKDSESLPDDITVSSLRRWLGGDYIDGKSRLSYLKGRMEDEPKLADRISSSLSKGPKTVDRDKLLKSLGLDQSASQKTSDSDDSGDSEKSSKTREPSSKTNKKSNTGSSSKKDSPPSREAPKKKKGQKRRKDGTTKYYSAGSVPNKQGREMTPDQIEARKRIGQRMINAYTRGSNHKPSAAFRTKIKNRAKKFFDTQNPSQKQAYSVIWATASDMALKGINAIREPSSKKGDTKKKD